MKRLIIIRHAKSSWAEALPDRHRPLTIAGIERAEKHAKILRENLNFEPELWVSSPAMRALHTAVIFAREMQRLDHLKVQKSLYTFSEDDLISAIAQFPDVLESAVMFGHNDACHQIIMNLTHENLSFFKTASVACLKFQQNRWENIANGQLEFIINKGILQ